MSKTDIWCCPAQVKECSNVLCLCFFWSAYFQITQFNTKNMNWKFFALENNIAVLSSVYLSGSWTIWGSRKRSLFSVLYEYLKAWGNFFPICFFVWGRGEERQTNFCLDQRRIRKIWQAIFCTVSISSIRIVKLVLKVSGLVC